MSDVEMRDQCSLVTLSRSEGSFSLGIEILRGVYTERSECAQHDNVRLADGELGWNRGTIHKDANGDETFIELEEIELIEKFRSN